MSASPRRIERDKEPLRPVQFESEQARQFFLGGVHDLQTHKQSSNVEASAVPFLWLNISDSTLSNNAIYNDQISACDTNGDGIISLQEAIVFRAIVAERVRAREMQAASADAKKDEENSMINVGAGSKENLPQSQPPAAPLHVSTVER